MVDIPRACIERPDEEAFERDLLQLCWVGIRAQLAHDRSQQLEALHTQEKRSAGQPGNNHDLFNKFESKADAHLQRRAARLKCRLDQVPAIQYLPLAANLVEAGTAREGELVAIHFHMPGTGMSPIRKTEKSKVLCTQFYGRAI